MALPLIHEKLPTKITMYHRTFKLNLDFRTILNMIEMFEDDFLSTEDKVAIAIKMLIPFPSSLLLMGLKYSQRTILVNTIIEEFVADPEDIKYAKENENKDQAEKAKELQFSTKKNLDIRFDAELIYAAFLQSYQIDLQNSRVDWRLFRSLLGNIPADTRLSEIIGIRVKPIPKPTKYNSAEIQAIKKAKARVAIKGTEEENEKTFQHDIEVLTDKLLAIAKPKGGG